MQNTFCINCFMDIHVKTYIKANGTYLGQKKDIDFTCSFCESADHSHNERYDILNIRSKKGIFYSKEIYVISQETLIEKFVEIINEHCSFIEDNALYYGRLENLIGIVNDIFHYERTDIIAKLAKYDFIKSSNFPFSESIIKDYNCGNKVDYVCYDILWENKWAYKKDFEVFSWNTFCEHTKHKARYFDHEKEYFKLGIELKKFDAMFEKLKITINNEDVYRARIANEKHIQEEVEQAKVDSSLAIVLGKAPVTIVKNNRFSPIGISYGYFAFDKQTALAEIRTEQSDIVAMGKFEITKPLKIVKFKNTIDFDSETNPFNEEFNLYITNLHIVLKNFLKDISKSIPEDVSPLEYVPTQIISEYIWSLGYDGFIFDSSQYNGGENLVIFGDNPECIEYELIEIEEKK